MSVRKTTFAHRLTMKTPLSEMGFRAAVMSLLEGHGIVSEERKLEILNKYADYIWQAEDLGMSRARCASNIMKREER